MAERPLAGSSMNLPSQDLASEVTRRKLTMAAR